MKLYKLTNTETWYFTNTAKAARYIGTTQSYLQKCQKLDKACKGWNIEEINSGEILSKYIDPEKDVVVNVDIDKKYFDDFLRKN